MITPEDKDEVMTFISLNGGPNQISLSDNTHLFHFHRSDWTKSPLILVNKNGNYCRILRNMQGQYFCVDTWNSLFDWQDWMFKMRRFDTDPEKILALISIGAGNKPETLSLFPRDAYPKKGRMACVRWQAIPIRFHLDSGTFTLTLGEETRTFKGKAWESREAFNVALVSLPTQPPALESGIIENPYERELALQRVGAELESNPLWGAFG